MSTLHKIPVTVPAHIGKVEGELWYSPDALDLSEDMLEIQCHNGWLIGVGWLNGRYVVRVSRDSQATLWVEAFSVEGAGEMAEYYALEYGRKS